jgi:hypothetical protein
MMAATMGLAEDVRRGGNMQTGKNLDLIRVSVEMRIQQISV